MKLELRWFSEGDAILISAKNEKNAQVKVGIVAKSRRLAVHVNYSSTDYLVLRLLLFCGTRNIFFCCLFYCSLSRIDSFTCEILQSCFLAFTMTFDIIWRRGKFPFRKRSLPFLRHWHWLIIESVAINKREDRNSRSNPDLSYTNLSPLPLHYHTDLPKFRLKILVTLSITLNVHSTWASTSLFLRLFKNVLFALL